MADTKDFGIITESLDKKLRTSFENMYVEFLNAFKSSCLNVDVVENDTVDIFINNHKIRSFKLPNKSWLVYNCPACFDVTNYMQSINSNTSLRDRIISILKTINNYNGTVIINGFKFDKENLINIEKYESTINNTNNN